MQRWSAVGKKVECTRPERHTLDDTLHSRQDGIGGGMLVWNLLGFSPILEANCIGLYPACSRSVATGAIGSGILRSDGWQTDR